MIRSLVSGLLAGLLDVLFYVNDMGVFATISYRVLKVYSIPLGVALHLVASAVVFAVAVAIIERSGVRAGGLASHLVLGIMVGSSALALFSLPVHLLFFPVKITLVYVIAHVFYGVFGYATYWLMGKSN